MAEAFARRLSSRAALLRLLARHPGRRGKTALDRLLDAATPPGRTRSEAEERLLALIRSARLPDPEINARHGRWEIDLLWRRQGVAVEVDGYASRSAPLAFHRDRVKTAELQASGLHVIRVTWQQVVADAPATLVLIARALVRPEAPPGRDAAP